MFAHSGGILSITLRIPVLSGGDPLSAKMAKAIDTILKPLFEQGGAYAGKVKVIFRLQVQPWHATSTLTHESGLAVRSTRIKFLPLVHLVCSGLTCITRELLALQSGSAYTITLPPIWWC